MKCIKCNHDAIEGTDKCPSHSNERARVRRYKLKNQDLMERMADLTSVDYMASLKEEVALAQTMLEQRINMAGSDTLAILATHDATNKSLETILKLVAAMQKHDMATGEVLAKPALERLMGNIVEDIAKELSPFEDHPQYADVIDRIFDRIGTRIESATNEAD